MEAVPRPANGSTHGQWFDGVVTFGDLIAVSGVGGNVTITTERPPYRIEPLPGVAETVAVEAARQRPSRLLLAEHRVVGLVGRDGDLGEVAAWMARPGGVLVRLLHAAGGQGKTRLAAHVAEACAATGWTVWRVLHEPVFSGGYRMDLPAGGGLLVVVDYADRWPVAHLQSLLTHLKSMNLSTGLTVRVLLLARSTTGWWPALRNRLRSDHQVDATTQPLPPLGDQVNREMLFQQARARFAAALDVAGADQLPLPTNLADEAFRQVLSIHMAALVAVDAHLRNTAAPTHPHALSSYLLERERDHWYKLHNRPAEPRKTPPEVMGRAVYLATLTAAVPRATAIDLLHRVGLTEPGTTTIIDDHRFCYPPDDPRTVLQALHPDRLGEDLIALFTPGHPHTSDEDEWDSDDWALTAAGQLLHTDTDPPPWAANTIAVLVETARRWDHVATDVLYPLLRRHPKLALAAGGATITRLTTIPGVDPDVLTAVDSVLPIERHVDLDVAAAAITTTLTRHQLAATDDPVDHARLHAIHAWRLANAGLHEQALDPAEEATGLYRQLAQADPAAHLPNLAMSLTNLGNSLSDLGRREEALVLAQEATGLYRQLAQANPAAHLPNLAMSLSNFGIRLSELRRWEDVLAPTQEAADLYRQLARTNPAVHLPNLAASLTNLGMQLAKLRRHDEALIPAMEAVTFRRQLARAYPAAHLPDLASSLINFGAVLSELGRWDEALAPTQEATDLYRQLAQANPAHLPNLAGALSNFGIQLSRLGRREALDPAEEATDLYRQLARAYPAAHVPDLPMSLWVYAQICVMVQDNLPHALGAVTEAVGLYSRLAEQLPQAFGRQLLSACHTMADVLDGLGRIDEASELRRQLAA
ncbi:tetratricopeptide repeat protein [Micromonospora chaiyaphumensis]|uniref:Tetratricopeptide (TPR) repeat n=1 Tax=Micromonospora chaiyaphumensis TaxID=307119 RepID=A0A1C4ZIU8_9ACTN|nr:tetratricopeptide repeat protein [Micromonospora chaiyaphumensis]SCF32868.1 Tetratricopeptide (TPR) repeat [Micromonospora chaiyaphumensis]